MKSISFLIKPASSLCDMRCRYCFYDDVASHREIQSHGIMNEEIVEALINKTFIIEDLKEVHFVFQGGEPTVAGITFFRNFIEKVNMKKTNQIVHYSIQTNGLSLNEEWADFYAEHKFLVGVSLDGYGQLHNYLRKDSKKEDTHARIIKAIQLLNNKKVEFNILSVLTAQMAKKPQKLYNFYKSQNIQYLQLIPCLPGLEEEKNDFSLSPKAFANFYKRFFDLWLKDYRMGNYMSVTLFDNMIPMLVGIPPQQCGMLGFCSPQLVLESNGDVYPCDFYVLDQYKCGNIAKDTIRDILGHGAMKKFIEEPRRECKECANCSFEKMCHRNCKRLNIAYYDEEYCGYKEFFEYAKEDMLALARKI